MNCKGESPEQNGHSVEAKPDEPMGTGRTQLMQYCSVGTVAHDSLLSNNATATSPSPAPNKTPNRFSSVDMYVRFSGEVMSRCNETPNENARNIQLQSHGKVNFTVESFQEA
jgi:hypothetical protein